MSGILNDESHKELETRTWRMIKNGEMKPFRGVRPQVSVRKGLDSSKKRIHTLKERREEPAIENVLLSFGSVKIVVHW